MSAPKEFISIHKLQSDTIVIPQFSLFEGDWLYVNSSDSSDISNLFDILRLSQSFQCETFQFSNNDINNSEINKQELRQDIAILNELNKSETNFSAEYYSNLYKLDTRIIKQNKSTLDNLCSGFNLSLELKSWINQKLILLPHLILINNAFDNLNDNNINVIHEFFRTYLQKQKASIIYHCSNSAIKERFMGKQVFFEEHILNTNP